MRLAQAGQLAATKKTYICPPCGQACDKLTFDGLGNGPQCGMKLIPANGERDADSPPTVAVLLFNAVEIIDFSGPWEVFGGAGYRLFSVSERPDPMTTVYGQKITADYTIDKSPAADVLLIPGGGVKNAVNSPATIEWVQENARSSKYVMSVAPARSFLQRRDCLTVLQLRR